jgi:GNAT superfamily N-acetyltransferase
MTTPDVRSAAADPAPYLSVAGFELSADQFDRQRPDERLLAWDGGRVVGRCGLWWRGVASHPPHTLGVVGHYFAESPVAGAALLNTACERLAKEGATLAVGPMDGSPWRRYRFVTDRGPERPFFLEPDNPDEYPAHWTAAGFAPLARYHSSLAETLATRHPRAGEIAARLADVGIAVRPMNPARFDADLARIYPLALTCFADNFLASPISAAEFTAEYAPLRHLLRPELVLQAERGDELIGFLLALPDLLQAKRGGPIDTVVAKTLAVRPDLAGAGLGTCLMDRLHTAAHALGFRRVIHALYHADNRSGRISRHTARVIRTYTLFARGLGGAG